MKDDGGPAFPQGEQVGMVSQVKGGMTLRDWFAGQALAYLLTDASHHMDEEQVALEAYSIADYMLEKSKP